MQLVEDIRGSGDDLDCRRVGLSTNVTLARSRWTLNYYITPVTGSSDQLEKMLESEPYPSRGWAPRPPVKQLRKTGNKCCCSQKSWGVNMLQFCSVSNKPLTDNTFRNPFEPFQIKWELYFSKELCPLVFIVLNMFLHTYVLCGYKIIIIIIIIIIIWVLFTPALADGFSLEFKWQQVSSSLQDSSLYSGRSQWCCSLDGLHSYSSSPWINPFRLFQVHQLQVVSPSPSCAIVW